MTRSGTTDTLNYSFVIKQIAAGLLGLVIAIVAVQSNGLALLRRWWAVAGILLLSMVLLVLTPLIGPRINGAQRWLDFGVIMFQPSELAKVALITGLAWYLALIAERVRVVWYGVVLPLFAFGVLAVLILATRDLGSVVILALVFWAMLFFAGANWLYLTTIGLLAVPFAGYFLVFQTTYRFERLLAFVDPWNTGSPAGYHLRQKFDCHRERWLVWHGSRSRHE